MKKIFFLLVVIFSSLAFFQTSSQAEGISSYIPGFMNPDVVVTIDGSSTEEKIIIIGMYIINTILFIAGIGATVAIVISGFRLTISTGSEEQLTGANKMLLYAVVGLILIIISFIIVSNVINVIKKYDA